MKIRHPLLVLTCAAALPNAAASQEVGGPFSADAIAYSKPAGTPDGLFINELLAEYSSPATVPGAPNPFYRLDQILGAGLAAVADIDAMSTGHDVIPIGEDDQSVFDPGGSEFAWVIMNISVSEESAIPAGPMLDALNDLPGGSGNVGSVIFGYGAPGSMGIDTQLIDNTWVDLTANQVDPQVPDLDAMDRALPLFATNGGDQDPVFLPNTSAQFYFSLTADSANAITPTQWVDWFDVSDIVHKNGASIFVSNWSGTWSKPQLYMGYDQLDLTAAHDVDALAVVMSGPHVVFSVTDTSMEQLWVIPYSAQGAQNPPKKKVLKTSQGTPVSQAIGGGSPGGVDVDGLCAYDPEVDQLSRLLSSPLHVAGKNMHLSIAAPLKLSNPMLATTKFTLSGWAGAAPSAGLVQFYWAPLTVGPSGLTVGGSAKPFLAPILRSATQHQVQFSLDVPVGSGGLQFAYWAVFTPNQGPAVVSYLAAIKY